MKKIFIVVVLTCLLSACATTTKENTAVPAATPKNESTYPTYNIPRSVDKIIKGLEGCTKEFAFDVMGLPSGEKTVDGKKYFEWSVRNDSCIVHAYVNDDGIIEKIYYQDTRNACKHMHLRITNYYYKHPAQSEQTCPNRTDLQGNHRNK